MCMAARRQRLLDRKLFKNNGDYTYVDVFAITALTLCIVYIFISVILFIEVLRGRPGKDLYFMLYVTLVAVSYPLFASIMVFMTCICLPDKCFRPCALLAISQVFLILFIVYHPYHTFVPGPFIEKFLHVFSVSYYAAFIWFPLLLISLLSCAIISWKASDQSELYTVVYGGKGSSTKKCHV